MISEQEKEQNFLKINNGYLSKSDPDFWRKLFKLQPNNYEAMYNVAKEIDTEAEQSLNVYNANHDPRYLRGYKMKKKEAHTLFRRSLREGSYLLARQPMVRIEQELVKINTPPPAPAVKPKSTLFKGVVIALLLALLGVSILSYLNKQPPNTKIINNTFAQMIPYQVHNEPPNQPLTGTYISTTLEVPKGVNEQDLANSMVNSLKDVYKQNPETPIKVTALEKGSNKEVGTLLWSGKDKNAEVYVYPLGSKPLIDAWEPTTVLRSALYQFTKQNGYMPQDLSDLTKPFPDNYLTSIPKEPNSLANTVVAKSDGTGGWVYTPTTDFTPDTLKQVITNILKPNIGGSPTIPFEPITIYIDKTKNELATASGMRKIKSYPVALGKQNLTPYGNFTIQKKIMYPDKNVPLSDNAYGTRGMELSDPAYAIHGTNTPASIGKNVSLGCIRLTNKDAEDLYSYVPLNTPVNIADRNLSQLTSPKKVGTGTGNGNGNGAGNNGTGGGGTGDDDGNDTGDGNGDDSGTSDNPPTNLYDKTDTPKEEDNSKFYTWNL